MKRNLFFLFLLAFMTIATVLQAQAPQAVTLQSVLRDAAGRLVSNRNVSVLISLRRGSNTGTVVYSETHTPTTNQNGLYTVFFGRGTAVTGTFAGIDWTQGPYYATVEADPNGGSNYTLTVSHPIVSVPYALYAEQTKEMQVLAYSNDTLYLRGGNTTTWVYLPAGGGGGGGCVPTCGKVDTIRHQLDSLINLSCIATTHYVTQSACDSYMWGVDGQTYNASGIYTYNRVRGNRKGCDSIEVLILTINHSTHKVSNESAVGFYEWHGTAYSRNGTYTYSYNNAVGCASVDTLKLSINTVGSLPGEFSVSATKKVRFSKGNLQFRPSARDWQFAGEQYTCRGSSHSNYTYLDYSGEYRSTNGNWMDLFGWGTSYVRVDGDGYNTRFEPWRDDAPSSNGTYNTYGYGPSINMISADLTGGSEVADWGVANRINNGGYAVHLWRTPASDEWKYLFETRHTQATGLTAPNSNNNDARFCHATVCGTAGIILFPDSYTHPSSGVSIRNINANGAFTDNNILETSWRVMEAAGAVFLPACGYRGYVTNNSSRPSINSVGAQGRYWSSTHKDQQYSYFLYFAASARNTQNNTERYYGLSVRLVQDVN